MDIHSYAQLAVCVCGCVSVSVCLCARVRVRARVFKRAYVRAAPAAPQRRLRRRVMAVAAPAAPSISRLWRLRRHIFVGKLVDISAKISLSRGGGYYYRFFRDQNFLESPRKSR